MGRLNRGDKIMLRLLLNEHRRLLKKNNNLKKELEAYFSVGSEMIAIHEELKEIIRKEPSKETLKALRKLKLREEKANKTQSCCFVGLSDKQINTEIELSAVATEISRIEIRGG